MTRAIWMILCCCLFVEEEIEEKECTNPAMAESFIEDMAELVTGIAEAHSFLDLEGSFSVTWKGTTSAYAFVSPGGDDGCDFQELGVSRIIYTFFWFPKRE